MSTSPNKLDRLLCLSSSIATSSSSLKTSIQLTLKQLIAVHESLLDSVFFQIDKQPQVCDNCNDGEQDNIKRILKPLVDSEEIETCKSILSMAENSNDEQILLVIQYLLRLSKLRSPKLKCETEHMLEGLTNTVFPLMMLSQHYDSQLRDAILDSSFSVRVPSGTCKDSTYYGNLKNITMKCCETITSSTLAVLASTFQDNTTLDWIHTVVEMSSRVLTRVLAVFESDLTHDSIVEREDCRQIVLNSMQKITISVLNSTCYFETECSPPTANGNGNTLLRPITALLLPALFPPQDTIAVSAKMSPYEDRLLEIWAFLIKLIKPPDKTHTESPSVCCLKRCRTWETTAPAVATGILCVLIPSVQTFLFPSANDVIEFPSQRQRLIHQSFIWDFLKKTLKSGIKTDEDWAGIKGGGGFGDVSRRSGRGVDDTFLENHMLVRRRTIHIMQLLLDKEHSLHLSLTSQQQKDNTQNHLLILLWKKYMLCFEALEMEKELHLVDQIWDTVLELCIACETNHLTNTSQSPIIPLMSWEWVGSLLARVLLSDTPTLRKLALFRFLNGQAGVSMSIPNTMDSNDSSIQNANATNSVKDSSKPIPLSFVAPSFVLEILLPSFDSLGSSVGTGVQFDVGGVKRKDDLNDLISPCLTNYMLSLGQYPKILEEFVAGLLTVQFINGCRTRTLILIFDAILGAWTEPNYQLTKVHIANETLELSVAALHKLLSSGSVLHQFRRLLMNKFAILLSHSSPTSSKSLEPKMVLKVLALFPSPIFCSATESTRDTSSNEELQKALAIWLGSFGKKWVSVIGAACAASFVSGQLLPFSEDTSRLSDEIVNLTASEQQMGRSIAKLCALSAGIGNASASSMLWPAISRGLSSFSLDSKKDHLLFSNQPQIPAEAIRKMGRATLLLQSGCNECVLNGMGHGDLIVDKKSESMLPPPINIELLLANALKFILYQISSLCNSVGADEAPGAACSGISATLSSCFSVLIDQIIAIHNAYPSSNAIPQLANNLLPRVLDTLLQKNQEYHDVDKTIERVRYMSLLFATLSFGAEVTNMNESIEKNLCADCCALLKMTFIEPQKELSYMIAQSQLKAIRSMFQLAKWGALSHLVPLAITSQSSQTSSVDEACDMLFDSALESVNAAPVPALLALFETTIVAAKHYLGVNNTIPSANQKNNPIFKGYVINMNKILNTLFSVMDETLHNPTKVYMLEKLCKLIFSPTLLLEEYNTIERNGENEVIDAPILKAFHKLLKISNRKPYVLKYVLSYIVVAWLGAECKDGMLDMESCRRIHNETGHESESKIGLAALPYREDIAKLLIHKEMKLDECASHQEDLVHQLRRRDDDHDELCRVSIPTGTPETSTARAFLLIFLSKLPDVDNGLSKRVLSDLCHYLIFWLLDNVTCCPTPERGVALMTGSIRYSRKIRAWQSLCLLARFVTIDVADAVLEKVFVSMTQTMHGQIRFFLEAFTIQCARLHPEKFRVFFVKEICRYDLPQQLLSSLMIIGGNLFVGRYSKEFVDTMRADEIESMFRSILSGVIPWLGSTQGFCRAIAQLLAHKMIPRVLSLESIRISDTVANDGGWFLKSIFEFLDVNQEMIRLRQKQSKFFHMNDVDLVCTPEGIFKLSIDEADEANPLLLVDIVKQCLVDIYNEEHAGNAPNWKQYKDLTIEHGAKDENDTSQENSEKSLVNFQRKILPLDSLNLALESHRKEKLQNAAGRKRQSLIVCASLIDKVPNLGGLARTAEIFAAEKLVIPNMRVCKMDNFRSISVTAGDWIDIEECGEGHLLSWLKRRKDDGYTIVGVEQTSSSKCLSNLSFPKQTVLLLGKEKEGIPVKFLQMVDICVEIPQLGIIRSLNVHVSGAIAIWEYTKQMMD